MVGSTIDIGNYILHEDGRIFSKNRNRFMTFAKNPAGYLCCNISGKQNGVHVFIAKAFIPNPENKPYVNHKDGNKANNAVLNLEWTTPSENNCHALKTGLRKPKLKDWQVKLSRWLIEYYPEKYTRTGLAKFYGVTSSHMAQVIRGLERSKPLGTISNG